MQGTFVPLEHHRAVCVQSAYTGAVLTDPLLLLGIAIMAASFSLAALACYWLRRGVEALERIESPQQRLLNAAYARFHLFLATVQLAALSRFR
jgi:hypothetical protein